MQSLRARDERATRISSVAFRDCEREVGDRKVCVWRERAEAVRRIADEAGLAEFYYERETKVNAKQTRSGCE